MTNMISKKVFSEFEKLNVESRAKIEEYMDRLLEYNKKINLISRKMKRENLKYLINETLCLNPLISKSPILDAGSGNGLLGVPLAIVNRDKKVVLVESKIKKQIFLYELKINMGLKNIAVQRSDVYHYLRKKQTGEPTMVARGFPNPDILISCLVRGMVEELLIITSKRKLIKIKKGLENIEQKIYNIPFRDDIVILQMENVSRETKRKKL